jgi:DNA repair protein RecN (Recombination protein N)
VDLEIAVNRELRDLGFANARFRADIAPAPFAATGADAVEFTFAPNPGEPEHALRDVASSGEIARVMLALKTVLAGHDRVPVLIFDEIDANIGGETGSAVGEKLRRVAAHGQVIAITHLPQSAAWGDRHFAVAKKVSAGRTRTEINEVKGEARVDELARMMGGEGPTDAVRRHAQELAQISR